MLQSKQIETLFLKLFYFSSFSYVDEIRKINENLFPILGILSIQVFITGSYGKGVDRLNGFFKKYRFLYVGFYSTATPAFYKRKT